MLVVTGVMIGFVLVVMVGQTARTMQGVGWLPITPIGGEPPYWLGVWFGVYPSWETLGAQVVAAVFVIGSFFVAQGDEGQAAGAACGAAPRSTRATDNESQCGHDHRAGHAPLADRVDLLDLHVGQPALKPKPTSERNAATSAPGSSGSSQAGEDRDVAAEAEHGDRDAGQLGPARGLHALAAAAAADADRLEPGVVHPRQVARDARSRRARAPPWRAAGSRSPSAASSARA